MPYNLLAIIGPTACGKTRLAVAAALLFDGEVISADSRQVYKELTIGTGKDLLEYQVNGVTVPYHLIDIVSAAETYDMFAFHNDFYKAFAEVSGRGKLPILCGGTGMYLSSILEQYQMQKVDFTSSRAMALQQLPHTALLEILHSFNVSLHNGTDTTDKERTIKAILIAEANVQHPAANKQRADLNPLIIGLAPERAVVRERITNRLKQRLENGMIEEVQGLLQQGFSYERLEYFGLEYRFIAQYLKGELTYAAMFEKLNTAIHSFAKRQMTWFRRMEKHGVAIHWMPAPDTDAIRELMFAKNADQPHAV